MSDTIKNALIRTAINSLEEVRKMYDADGVKVYFQDIEHYAVKMIKDNKVKAIIRHKRNSFDNK